MNDREERWMRRWLWVLAALALLAHFIPMLMVQSTYRGGPGAPEVWELGPGYSDTGTLLDLRLWIPIVWAVLALMATRLGWGARTAALLTALLSGPLIAVAAHAEFALNIPEEWIRPPIWPAVITATRYALVGLALGLIASVAHGHRRQLPGRAYRWMILGSTVVWLDVAASLVARAWSSEAWEWYALSGDWFFRATSGPGARDIADYIPEASGLAVLGAYALYATVALVTGVRSWNLGRRSISLSSRVGLLMCFVVAIPWIALEHKPSPEHMHYALTWTLKNGARFAADVLVGALVVASWFEWRARRADRPDLDAFA